MSLPYPHLLRSAILSLTTTCGPVLLLAALGAANALSQEPATAAGAAVDESPAQKTEPGPMMRMSNKEFWENRGEERFLRVRGNMVPQKADDQPDMSNADYIKRFGIEQFLARRGSLTITQQRVKQPVSP